MKIKPEAVMIVLALLLLLAVGAFIVANVSSCSPVARYAPPISQSHSQLTASEYDAAETAFGGGGAPEADARCQALLEKRDVTHAVMLGLCSATGAGGLATLIPKDVTPEERKQWDIGLGATTLGLGITCTTLGALVHSWSEQYEQECRTIKEDE